MCARVCIELLWIGDGTPVCDPSGKRSSAPHRNGGTGPAMGIREAAERCMRCRRHLSTVLETPLEHHFKNSFCDSPSGSICPAGHEVTAVIDGMGGGVEERRKVIKEEADLRAGAVRSRDSGPERDRDTAILGAA